MQRNRHDVLTVLAQRMRVLNDYVCARDGSFGCVTRYDARIMAELSPGEPNYAILAGHYHALLTDALSLLEPAVLSTIREACDRVQPERYATENDNSERKGSQKDSA